MEEYKFNLDKCNNIQVPSEIHSTINSSIIRAKAQQEKKKKIIKYFSSIAASLAIFVAFINMSPAIASNISKIPGLEYLVELVTFDKGLRSAIENNFVQHIDKSAEDKNIKLTIKDVIVDKRNIIIAYKVSSTDKSYNDLNISLQSSIQIIDDKNNNLIGTIQTSNYPNEDFKITGQKEGIITARFNDDILIVPENVKIMVKEMQDGYYDDGGVYKSDRIYGEWAMNFNIDRSLASAEPYSYAINEKIDIDNKLNVMMRNVIIYPTSGEITYQVMDNQEYKFINFINARLVDDKGLEYKLRGGMGSVDGQSGTLFSESTYFTQSKELYFKADGALFIKKDMEIVVDLKNKKILDDCGLDMEFMYGRFENEREEKSYDVALKIKDKEIIEKSKLPGNYWGGIGFSDITDKNDTKYNTIGSFHSSDNKDLVTGEEYIIGGISIYGITEEPEILKLKVYYANKGSLKPIKIKVK